MRLALLGAVIAAALTAVSAVAQQRPDPELETRFMRQQYLIDQELDQERQQAAPLETLVDVQYGGWFEYYLFSFDDGIQSSRFSQRPGFALWARITADDGAHEIFARARARWTWFRRGDEIDKRTDFWGPNFDQAWYQIDVGKAFRLTKPSDPVQLRVRIGRQTIVFGTGYTLDMPMDAVLLDAKLDDFRVQGLFGKTFSSYPNIDSSEPVDSHSNRLFYGVQALYEGWQKHVPFAYAIWNNDRTDERPKDFFQDYSYDSFYAGIGARGELAPDLNYWAEGVFESGRSFANRAFLHQDDIHAWGWDVGIEKIFRVPTSPAVSAEYMYASGDADRTFSPTNAAGGNRRGTTDHSFVAFGFRDTGISAAFIPSNLHIWRVGGSLKPLENHVELFRDLEIGTNWFLYQKNHKGAAISDITADNFDGWVGWEMDYFVNWRLASDVSWTIRWGTFFPGTAYSDRECRHFLFSGVTWSF